ncbi:hypothetical protein MPSEU_000070900 [Mayamaea pseudoterrestris]|nr:hypothetical protein MPSEU_000070900 [Mayamaea pseudoterrestris]
MPPRPRTKLSNCYPLLPLPSHALNSRQSIIKSRDGGDGTKRSSNELRRLYLESGTTDANAHQTPATLTEGPTGVSLVELGHTKVVCHVVLAPSSISDDYSSESPITCTVQYAPFAFPVDQLVAETTTAVGSADVSGTTRLLRSTLQMRQNELSNKLTTAMNTTVPWPPLSSDTAPLTASALMVRFVILQDDGGVLAACLTAASLALADACIEQYDVLVCGSVACMRGNSSNSATNTNDKSVSMTYLADPDWREMAAADATMTLAMLPNLKQVVLWEQAGSLTLGDANQAMETCRSACRTMHKFLRQHWIDKA